MVLAAALGAALVGSCQQDRLARILPPGVRVDVFPQVSRAQLDTLFVVDNADHIAPDQQKVADSFGLFLDYLDQNQIDYHVGIVTTDLTPELHGQAPQYQGGGSSHYFAAGDANLRANLTATIVGLGDKGSALEAALQQLDLSLKAPPPGFLRDGAALFLVAVTDDDDPWSPNNGTTDPASPDYDLYYVRAFRQAKGAGNDGLVTFSVIAGDLPNGCSIPDPLNPSSTFFADPANRLTALAHKLGGVTHSICDPSFDAVFRELGASAAGLKRAFRLAQVPDLATLVVSVRAPCDALPAALTACTQTSNECTSAQPALVCTPRMAAQDGWQYDASTNSIIFNGASVPPRASIVEVQYAAKGGAQ